MTKMTLKQQRFADEYIITGNLYKSAVEAGYSEKYAKSQSHKLLDNVGIKSYIDERLAKLESEKIASQQEILSYLSSVMRGEMTEQTLRSVGESGQVIAEIDVGAKDRIKAAELLGKRYKLWTEKQEVTSNNVTEIVWDIPNEDV